MSQRIHPYYPIWENKFSHAEVVEVVQQFFHERVSGRLGPMVHDDNQWTLDETEVEFLLNLCPPTISPRDRLGVVLEGFTLAFRDLKPRMDELMYKVKMYDENYQDLVVNITTGLVKRTVNIYYSRGKHEQEAVEEDAYAATTT